MFLGAFEKLRKATINCPSVDVPLSVEQLDSHWTDFHEISHLRISRKFVAKIQV
jgi:hypothetical protein